MITMNLHKSNKIGQTIRLQDGIYRIVRETGLTFDCLSGGKGVRQVKLVKTTDEKTTNELKYIEEAKVQLFERDIQTTI